jgi:DNA (cytosine-5)-methyltransferase 1
VLAKGESMGRDRITFIDLFAGIGGVRLGFESAVGKRARCVFSSEIDEFACRTYEANHGEHPAGDITRIDAAGIPLHDVLLAGFPCQPFSIAGVSKYGSLGRKTGFLDKTKGTLFFDIARILKHHRPRAFLLENVKNLLSHDNGQTWHTIEDTLAKLGYYVDNKVIDARLVVPQHRERIYIAGFLEPVDWSKFWPAIEDQRPTLGPLLDKHVDPKYTLTDHLWAYLQAYATRQHERGNGFGFGLVTDQDTTRTLSARYYKDGSEILVDQGPDRNPRRLTPRECSRLMGFPEAFSIPVSDTQAYKQFGNSVVVPVVRIISRALVGELDRQRAEGKTPRGK